MPTGYTAGVQDGTIKTFREFALRCARAMGACITQREDAWDVLPKEAIVSDHHLLAGAAASDELAAFTALSAYDMSVKCGAVYDIVMRQYAENKERAAEQKARYVAMLVQVRAWQPPTKDHEGLKAFMVEQLESSIKWDCGGCDVKPERVPVGVWRDEKVRQLTADVAYHAKKHAEEVERVAARNRWIRDLYESVGLVTA